MHNNLAFRVLKKLIIGKMQLLALFFQSHCCSSQHYWKSWHNFLKKFLHQKFLFMFRIKISFSVLKTVDTLYNLRIVFTKFSNYWDDPLPSHLNNMVCQLLLIHLLEFHFECCFVNFKTEENWSLIEINSF